MFRFFCFGKRFESGAVLVDFQEKRPEELFSDCPHSQAANPLGKIKLISLSVGR